MTCRSLCPILAYVQHHHVMDFLRLGWMVLPQRYSHPMLDGIMVGWPCKCPYVMPRKKNDGPHTRSSPRTPA